MTDAPPFEPLFPCVLDTHDVDQLLERLRAVHGEPRRDIAPQLLAATRRDDAVGIAADRPRSLAARRGKLRLPVDAGSGPQLPDASSGR